MAPSRGNQDIVNDATDAVAVVDGDGDGDGNANVSRRSSRSPLDASLLNWFVNTANERPHEEEEVSSEYHIWKHQFANANATTIRHVPDSLSKDERRATTIAACFLKDYEDGRPPTLSPSFESITDQQLEIYLFKHSTPWRVFGLSLATILLFVGIIGRNPIWTLALQSIAILLFTVDLYMKWQLLPEKSGNGGSHHSLQRNSISGKGTADRWLMGGVAALLCIYFLQTCVACWFLDNDVASIHPSTLAVSMFKPIVFFYQSRRARDALEALVRIGKKLLRVILIELYLILTFAAVACRLYADDESFQTLSRSWLSLFALSTTVVNPGIWMPAYNESAWNAIFFVIFIVVGVFYLHSLVLSVVFQVFIQSATEVHRRSVSDKEQSLRLSFLALTSSSTAEKTFVNLRMIREMLHLLRPRYSRLKLRVLSDIVTPSASGIPENESGRDVWEDGADRTEETYPLKYSQFRNRIRQVLTSSVRVTRSYSVLGLAVEVVGASCAALNLVYVILLTSKFDAAWFVDGEFFLGSILTFAALLEALLRYNPIKFAYRLDPMSRLNAVLDFMGLAGGLISFLGIILKMAGYENGMDFLLTGRAVGMIQSMRFSVWFREVLQRSLYVLPLLSGPIVLVLSTIHVFVCIGMLLWSGSVDVEELSTNENVEPLFYLNNFNSFGKGFITIFNVLVVNDWHQIANVFLYANRNSDPFIVFLFFIAVVIVAVCIMLNVIVAFFVETFVTQLNLVDVEDEVLAGKRDPLSFDATELHKTDIISTNCSLTGETLQFDVIKREGYDEMIENVANQSCQSEAFAKSLRDTMETLKTMSPTSDLIGHVFCCRQNLSQFRTENFRRLVGEYLRQDEVHVLVQEMMERLSDAPSIGTPAASFEFEQTVQRYSHPSDATRILLVAGAILPHNRSIAVLTAQVTSA